jgi:hypothetical protein
MKTAIAAIALMFAAAPAFAQTVEVGSANWENLPPIQSKPSRLNQAEMVAQIEAMLRKRECVIPNQSMYSFDLLVPYAVQLNPQGKVERVLVGQMDCKPLEQLVGVAVLAKSDMGEFLPTGENKPRWYGGTLGFAME